MRERSGKSRASQTATSMQIVLVEARSIPGVQGAAKGELRVLHSSSPGGVGTPIIAGHWVVGGEEGLAILAELITRLREAFPNAARAASNPWSLVPADKCERVAVVKAFDEFVRVPGRRRRGRPSKRRRQATEKFLLVEPAPIDPALWVRIEVAANTCAPNPLHYLSNSASDGDPLDENDPRDGMPGLAWLMERLDALNVQHRRHRSDVELLVSASRIHILAIAARHARRRRFAETIIDGGGTSSERVHHVGDRLGPRSELAVLADRVRRVPAATPELFNAASDYVRKLLLDAVNDAGQPLLDEQKIAAPALGAACAKARIGGAPHKRAERELVRGIHAAFRSIAGPSANWLSVQSGVAHGAGLDLVRDTQQRFALDLVRERSWELMKGLDRARGD